MPWRHDCRAALLGSDAVSIFRFAMGLVVFMALGIAMSIVRCGGYHWPRLVAQLTAEAAHRGRDRRWDTFAVPALIAERKDP